MNSPTEPILQDFLGGYDMFLLLINVSNIDLLEVSSNEGDFQEVLFIHTKGFEDFKNQIKRYSSDAKQDIYKTLINNPTRFEKLHYIGLRIDEVNQALSKLTQTDGLFSYKDFEIKDKSGSEKMVKSPTESKLQDYYQLIYKYGTEFLNYLIITETTVKNTADGDFPSPDPISGIPPRSSKNRPLAFFEYFFTDGGFTRLYQDHFAYPDGFIDPNAHKPDCEKASVAEVKTSAVSQDDFNKQFEKNLEAKINDEYLLTRTYIDERVNSCTSESEVTLFLKTQLYGVKSIHAHLLKNKQAIEYDICEKVLQAIIRYIFKKHEPFTQEFRTESFFSKIVGVTQQLPMIEKPERPDNFESKADDYSIINLTPRITQEIPKKIVEMYYKQYNPEDYIVVDLTSNFERKHSEEIKRTAPEPPRLFYDIYGLVEDDNMIGLMMMPIPAKLSISQTQLTLFNNLLTDKGFEHIDFSKRTFQTISFEYFNYDYIPEELHKGVMPFLYYYRKGFFTGYKLLRANKQEENSKRNLRYINEVTSPPPISDFKDSTIYAYWRDMGLKQGRLYSIWQTILENPDEFAGLFENEKIRQEQPSDRRTISATRKIIEDSFDEMGSKGQKGWQYAFRTENDYKKFVSLLEKYFMLELYELPEETLLTRPKTKTQIAQAIHRIYKELGEELKSDTEFFKIIRYLKVFNESEDAEIYKSITRSSGF